MCRGLVNQRKTPPGANPAAWCERERLSLCFHGISAFAVLDLGGNDGQSHLLAQRSAAESAHGIRLPASCLLEFLGGRALRPFHPVQDCIGFAALADSLLLCALLRA